MSTSTRATEDRFIERRQLLRRPDALAVWSPCLVVVVSTIVIGVADLRGADYPAHFLRALLWERSGMSAWNNLWYGGHATPTYSVLAPPVMAAIGPFGVVALGSIVATYCFSRLTVDLLPTRTTSLANHVFALVMLVNVVVGRAPFALGLALGLVAVAAWDRQRTVVALAAAFSTPLVSPVAAVFLAIASTAVALSSRPRAQRSPAARTTMREAVAITCAATAPIAAAAVLFGDSGWFPFRGGHFAACMITLSLVATGISSRVVRFTAVLAMTAAVVLFLVPNPLGGNFVRLAQIVAVPIAVAALPSVRRALLVPFTLALLAGFGWSLQPGVVAAVEWWGDESADAAFHQPLIDQVRARNLDGLPLGRLEIPFTENHWESFFVAAEVPFARGWERQVDLARNAPLYAEDLSIVQYRDWLRDNGVRWIAVADAPLDHAGAIEQRLIDGSDPERIPWLQLVWSNDDWRLFEVEGYAPIVERPAELVEQGTDSLVVHTDRPATVTIRYRYSEYLTIDGSACVEPDEQGWIVARLPAAGEYRLSVDPAAAWVTPIPPVCE